MQKALWLALAGLVACAPAMADPVWDLDVYQSNTDDTLFAAVIYDGAAPDTVDLNYYLYRYDGSTLADWTLVNSLSVDDKEFATVSLSPLPIVLSYDGVESNAQFASRYSVYPTGETAWLFGGVSGNIPEPATMGLLIAGAAGLIARRRRR